jgi:phage terminase small subunit
MTTKTSFTTKQQRFIDHMASNGGNGAQAYRDSGFSTPNATTATTGAHRLMTNSDIVTAIARKQDHLQAKTDITRADVLVGLHDIATTGNHESSRVSAWGKIADILGLVTRKVDISDKRNPVRDQLAGMTLDAVLALMARWENELDALPSGNVIDGDVIEGDVRG